MKSLFNQYEAMNEDGCRLARDFEDVIEPVILRFVNEGYSLREISATCFNTLDAMLCEKLLLKGIRMRQKERESTLTKQG